MTKQTDEPKHPPRKYLVSMRGIGEIPYQISFDTRNEAAAHAAQEYPKVCPIDEFIHADEMKALLQAAKAEAFEEAANMRQRGAMVQEYLEKALQAREGK